MVLKNLDDNDLILCQITGKLKDDNYSINLEDKDFIKGKLNIFSKIRPNKLFTADKSIIKYKIGKINNEKFNEVINSLINILKN